MGVGDAARDLRGRLIQFVDAVFEAVHEEPRPTTSESICREQLSAGIRIPREDPLDLLRAINVPQFRRSTIIEPRRLKHGAHGAITGTNVPSANTVQKICHRDSFPTNR